MHENTAVLRAEWVGIDTWGEEQKKKLLETRSLALLSVAADKELIDTNVSRIASVRQSDPDYAIRDVDRNFIKSYPKVRKRELDFLVMNPLQRLLARVSDRLAPPYTSAELAHSQHRNTRQYSENMEKLLMRRADEDEVSHFYEKFCIFVIDLAVYEKKKAKLEKSLQEKGVLEGQNPLLQAGLQLEYRNRLAGSLQAFFKPSLDGSHTGLKNLTEHWEAFRNLPQIKSYIPEWSTAQFDSAYLEAFVNLTLETTNYRPSGNSWQMDQCFENGKLHLLKTADAAAYGIASIQPYGAEEYLLGLPDEELTKLASSPNPGFRNLARGIRNNPQYFQQEVLKPSVSRVLSLWYQEFKDHLPYFIEEALRGGSPPNGFERNEWLQLRQKVNLLVKKYRVTKNEIFACNMDSYESNPSGIEASRNIALACYYLIENGHGSTIALASKSLLPEVLNESADFSHIIPEMNNRTGYDILVSTFIKRTNPQERHDIAELWGRGRDWQSHFPVVINSKTFSDDLVRFISVMGAWVDGEINFESLIEADQVVISKQNIEGYFAFLHQPPPEWNFPSIMAALRSGLCLEKMYSGDSLIERLKKLEQLAPVFFRIAKGSEDTDWARYALGTMLSPKNGELFATQIEATLAKVENKKNVAAVFTSSEFWNWADSQPQRLPQLLSTLELIADTAYEANLAITIFKFLMWKIGDTPLTSELFSSYITLFKGWPENEVTAFLEGLTKSGLISLTNPDQITQVDSYLRTFGTVYLVELYKAHSQLMAGGAPTENLIAIGVISSGKEGLKQLEEFYKRLTIGYIQSGDIKLVVSNMQNPLVFDIFAHLTRFNISQWARVGLQLDKIVQQHQETVKKRPDVTRIPEYYQPAHLMVEPIRQKADFEVTQDAKDKYLSYFSDLEWALSIKIEKWDEAINAIKSELIDLTADMSNGITKSKAPEKIKTEQTQALVGKDGHSGLLDTLGTCDSLEDLVLTIVNFADENGFAKKALLSSQQFRRLMVLKAVQINSTYAQSVHDQRPTTVSSLTTDHLDSLSGFLRAGVLDEAVRTTRIGLSKSLSFIQEKVFGTQIFAEEILRSQVKTDDLEEIGVYPSRDLRLELSGYSGDACWTRKSDIVANNPDMVGLTYVRRVNEVATIIGTCLVIEGILKNGDEAVIIRGINPRENYIRKLSAQGFFEQQVDVIEKWLKQKADLEAKKPGIWRLRGKRNKKIHIVAPPGESGALTNRPSLSEYVETTYGSRQVVAFAKSVNFNGYDITSSCRVIRTIEVGKAT